MHEIRSSRRGYSRKFIGFANRPFSGLAFAKRFVGIRMYIVIAWELFVLVKTTRARSCYAANTARRSREIDSNGSQVRTGLSLPGSHEFAFLSRPQPLVAGQKRCAARFQLAAQKSPENGMQTQEMDFELTVCPHLCVKAFGR